MHIRRGIGAFGTLLLLLLLLGILEFQAIQTPEQQSYLLKEVIHYINKNTQTILNVDSIYLDIEEKLVLRNVFLAPNSEDTIIHAPILKVNFKKIDPFVKKIDIEGLVLESPTIYINRGKFDKKFNIETIIDEISNSLNQQIKDLQEQYSPIDRLIQKYWPAPSENPTPWEFTMDYIRINEPNFVLDDKPKNIYLAVKGEAVDLGVYKINLNKNFIDGLLTIRQSDIYVHDTKKDIRVNVRPTFLEANLQHFDFKTLKTKGQLATKATQVLVRQPQKSEKWQFDFESGQADLSAVDLNLPTFVGLVDLQNLDFTINNSAKNLNISSNSSQINANLYNLDLEQNWASGLIKSNNFKIKVNNNGSIVNIKTKALDTDIQSLDIDSVITNGFLKAEALDILVENSSGQATAVNMSNMDSYIKNFNLEKSQLQGLLNTQLLNIQSNKPNTQNLNIDLADLAANIKDFNIKTLIGNGIINTQTFDLQLNNFEKQQDIFANLTEVQTNLADLDIKKLLVKGELIAQKAWIEIDDKSKMQHIFTNIEGLNTAMESLDLEKIIAKGQLNAQKGTVEIQSAKQGQNITVNLGGLNTDIGQLDWQQEIVNGQLNSRYISVQIDDEKKQEFITTEWESVKGNIFDFNPKSLTIKGLLNAGAGNFQLKSPSKQQDIFVETKTLEADFRQLDLKNLQLEGLVNSQEMYIEFDDRAKQQQVVADLQTLSAELPQLDLKQLKTKGLLNIKKSNVKYFDKIKQQDIVVQIEDLNTDIEAFDIKDLTGKGLVNTQKTNIQFDDRQRGQNIAIDLNNLEGDINQIDLKQLAVKGILSTNKGNITYFDQQKQQNILVNLEQLTANLEKLDLKQQLGKGLLESRVLNIQFDDLQKEQSITVSANKLNADISEIDLKQQIIKGLYDSNSINVKYFDTKKQQNILVNLDKLVANIEELDLKKQSVISLLESQKLEFQFDDTQKKQKVFINADKLNTDIAKIDLKEQIIKGLFSSDSLNVNYLNQEKQQDITVNLEQLASDINNFDIKELIGEGLLKSERATVQYIDKAKQQNTAINMLQLNSELRHIDLKQQIFNTLLNTNYLNVKYFDQQKQQELLVELPLLKADISHFDFKNLASNKLLLNTEGLSNIQFSDQNKEQNINANIANLNTSVDTLNINDLTAIGNINTQKIDFQLVTKKDKSQYIKFDASQLNADLAQLDLKALTSEGAFTGENLVLNINNDKQDINTKFSSLHTNSAQLDLKNLILKGDLGLNDAYVKFHNKEKKSIITTNLNGLQGDLNDLDLKKIIANGKINSQNTYVEFEDLEKQQIIRADFEKLQSNINELSFDKEMGAGIIDAQKVKFRLQNKKEDTDFTLNLADLKADIPFFNPQKQSGNGRIDAQEIELNFLGNNQTKKAKLTASQLISNLKNIDIKQQKATGELSLSLPNLSFEDSADSLSVLALMDELKINLKELDVLNKLADISFLALKKPNITVEQRSLKVNNKQIRAEDYFEQVVHLDSFDWLFNAEKIAIDEGNFNLKNHKDLSLYPAAINYKNIKISDLKADIEELIYGEDEFKAQINWLSGQEQSGFKLKQLSANIRLTPKQLDLNNFKFITPNSNLGHSLSMTYNTLNDFSDFVNRVTIEADFEKKSHFIFKDISYFSSALLDIEYLQEQNNKKIYLTGLVKGKINKFKSKDFEFALENSRFKGGFKFSGLPDFNSTDINVDVKLLNTDMEEVRKLLPKNVKIPDNFDKLGEVSFDGSFQGFPKNFVAYGELQTDLGILSSDLKMDIDSSTTKYSGDLAAIDFDLGKWTEKPKQFGKISFAATINGQGLKLEELDADIKGIVEAMTFNKYIYRDLTIDGNVKQQQFDGFFKIKDKNLKMQFQGAVDLNDLKVPKFNLTAIDISKAHLQNINLVKRTKIKEDLIISGKGSLNLKGIEIDNFEGQANLNNIKIQQGSKSLTLNKLSIKSDFQSFIRKVNIKSPALDANFSGIFNFTELANATQNYLHTYFPYRFDYTESTSSQNINFNIYLKNPVPIATFFEPSLEKMTLKNGYLNGYLNTNAKQMKVDIRLPRVAYDGVLVDTIKIAANSDNHQINFNTTTKTLDIKGTSLPSLALNGAVFNDSITFDIKAAPDSAATRFRLEGLLFANSDTLKMNFSNTEIVLQNQAWQANTGNFIYKNKDYFMIDDIELTQGTRKIAISSSPSKKHRNQTDFYIQDIALEDFKEQVKIFREMDIKGIVNGNLEVADIFKKQIITGEIDVDNFQLKGEEIGKVKVKASKQKAENQIDILAKIEESNYGVLAKGTYRLPDADNENDKGELDIKTDIDYFPLEFMDIFVGSFTSDLTGTARGDLHIGGSPDDLKLNGEMLLINGGLTIDFLNTNYTFHNQKVTFRDKYITLENAALNDKYNNTAKISAELFLNDFKNLWLEAKMSSDEFLFMNTSITDNETFYGTALGSGSATFKGPLNQLELYVNGKSKKGTKIYLPISYEDELSEEKFYTFINPNKTNDSLKLVQQDSIDTNSGLKVKLDLDVTNDAEIQIIFDLQAGDIIRSIGHGNMQVLVNTIGGFDFDVYGNYYIDKGDYLFTLQNLVNKRFQVESGGSVQFAGSPYDALLDVSAIYNLKAARKELLEEEIIESLSNEEQKELSRRVPVDVSLDMTGSLSKPNINFNIQFPDKTSGRIDNMIGAKVLDMKNNKSNQIDKQVFGLLVLNKFLPKEDLDIFNIQSGINTTVSELLSSYLSNYLGEAISNIIPDSDFNVNWRRYDAENPSGENQLRDEIELVFTKRLFDDRLSIDIGGNFDLGENSQNSSGENIAIAGDFIIKYNITEDGRFKLIAFNKYDNDVFTGDYNKAGVSLSATEEFDTFKDLFAFKKRRAKRKAEKAKQRQRQQQQQQANPK